MKTEITAYLNFPGNCKEAMIFYQECIGGTLSLMTVAETSAAGQMPPDMQDKIMHSILMREGGTMVMASDMMGRNTVPGNQVGLSLNCESEEQINTFFSKLSEGGNVTHPLKTEFWGALFGHFTDKYGIGWMLNYDKPKE